MNKTTLLCLSAFMLLGNNLLNAETKITEATKVVEAPKVKVINIVLPKVPEVPKVKAVVPVVNLIVDGQATLNNKEVEENYQNVMLFSNRVPPGYNDKDKEVVEHAKVGDIDHGRVAAYLHTKIMSVDEAKANLKKAGFDVLSTYKVDKKGKAISIVFTNDAITKAASKKSRGFASSLRMLIDNKNHITSISNPIYMMKAFMQEEYDSKLATATLTSIRDAFSGLENSSEMIKFRVLERFHFMENMPYYQDMSVIGKSSTNDTLMKKAKKSKKIVYQQKLANGSYIVGVKLGSRTSKFIKKTGYTNSGLLPYPVLIEDGKAKILDPKYYIAVMYPMLKMSQFMKIATIPGAIEKDCDRIFR